MLTEICANLHNWFVVKNSKHSGSYTVKNGGILLPFLADGQYYRIIGSVFNDGVHQYPSTDLTDETFDGAVWAMAVPPAVLALADEIKEYATSAAAKASPYQSESFPNGYSYSKGSGKDGSTDNGWNTVFANRLNVWRKLQ